MDMRFRSLLTLTFALLSLATSALHAQVTAIRAGTLIDPVSGSAARDQIILVEGTTVKALGAKVAIPRGAAVIDLSGSAVLPGLFDAHTHLCMTVDMRRDAGRYYYTTLNDPDSYRAIQGVANARSMLEAGFTTVRDVGNEGKFACASLRRAVSSGLVDGPTIINAGRIIAPYGGQFKLQPDKGEVLATPEYFFADTRDELLKAVRENIHYGATVIKLVVDDQHYIYTPEDIRFVVDEAAKSGLKVAAHVWTKAGAHNAAGAGVASMEHLNGISDEDLALAKRNGVVAVFTFPGPPAGRWRSPGSTATSTRVSRPRRSFRR
jgi:imidazolonepropionase-like amidohydrolase